MSVGSWYTQTDPSTSVRPKESTSKKVAMNDVNPNENKVALPDPDSLPDGDVVIYDGKCRFCTQQVMRLHRLDCRKTPRLTFLSLHDQRVSQRYPNLTYDHLMEQMVVVAPNGTQYGGADAIRYLSRRLPRLWILMPLLHLPGTTGLLRWLYRQIAKRRYRLSKDSCPDGACSVHFRTIMNKQTKQ